MHACLSLSTQTPTTKPAQHLPNKQDTKHFQPSFGPEGANSSHTIGRVRLSRSKADWLIAPSHAYLSLIGNHACGVELSGVLLSTEKF
jgi:hypothetical protein